MHDISIKQWWQAGVTTQIAAASISFLASLLMVASIGKSFFPVKRNSKHDERHNMCEVNNQDHSPTSRLKKKKKTSPYRRIIFLISFCDILHSLAYITGPFMAQKTNPQALWAVSESNTACVLNGIFFQFGASTSQLYYATLGYFYYCKISKRMTDEQFMRRYEKKIHIMIAILGIASTCLGLAAKIFNTFATGTFCAYSNTPAGCNQQPEIYGECDPKVKGYSLYFTSIRVIIQVFSIVVMLYSMIRLVHTVLKKDRMFGELPSNPSQEQLHKYNLRKQLLKQTIFQAIMYNGSWLICQSVSITVVILHFTGVSYEKFPPALAIGAFTIVPLNGAVNVFIYTRPAVQHVRRVDPSISRFRAFWMVLQAGGEAPNMEQSSSSNQNQQHQPQPEPSSREPFGRGEEYYGSDFSKGLDSLKNVSSADLRVMFSEDLVERVSVSTWSAGLDIASKSKIHGLEDHGTFLGKDVVNNYSHDYDPRPVFEGKNVDMLERSERRSEVNAAGNNHMSQEDSGKQSSTRQS